MDSCGLSGELPSTLFNLKKLKIMASDKYQREKRKTINGDDLLWAMGTLGFEEYVEPLNFTYSIERIKREGELGGAISITIPNSDQPQFSKDEVKSMEKDTIDDYAAKEEKIVAEDKKKAKDQSLKGERSWNQS